MSHRVAAVVLAAGFGRRFGAGNKLHQQLAGRPLLCHSLAPLSAVGLAEVIVVHAPEDALAGELAQSFGFRALANPARAQGLGKSLASGVAALSQDITAVLVVLGDMPRIPAAAHRAVVAAFTGDETEIWVPTFEARAGHPVLFGRAHFAALAALNADEGARSVLAARPAAVRRLALAEPGILLDVDTPAGLQALE